MHKSSLCIGTAQFGQEYGITNKESAVDEKRAELIFKMANENGINTVDTAQDYGESEKIIGRCRSISKDFKIITKLKKIELEKYKRNEILNMLNKMQERSLRNLRREKLEGLLIHDPKMIRGDKGSEVVEWLKEQKESGKVRKIGVSIYEMKDITEQHMEWIDIIQAPYSIYDQRIMLGKSKLKEMIKRGEIELHARSIYLQGIILERTEKLPKFLTEELKVHHERLHTYAKRNSVTTMDIAIKFIQRNPLISKAVIGIANSRQLGEIVESWERVRNMELESDWNWEIKGDIDPRYWRRDK